METNNNFLDVVKAGNFEMVQDLIQKLPNSKIVVNTKDDYKTTALMHAVKLKNYEMVKFLIEKGADLISKDIKEMSAFMYAVESKDYKMMDTLIDTYKIELKNKRSSDIGINKIVNMIFNLRDKDGTPFLINAIKAKDFEMVKFLIEKGANVDDIDKSKSTALIEAAEAGNDKIVYSLIKSGANLAAKGQDEMTPLIIASLFGRDDIAQLIIESAKGAFFLEDGSVRFLDDKIIDKFLNEKEKNLFQKGNFNTKDGLDVIVNAADIGGMTPLEHSINLEHREGVKFLIENGANVSNATLINSINSYGNLSGYIEAIYEIIELILQKDSLISKKDKENALELAIQNYKNLDEIGKTVAILIADNNEGEKAKLQIATQNYENAELGNEGIAKTIGLLLKKGAYAGKIDILLDLVKNNEEVKNIIIKHIKDINIGISISSNYIGKLEKYLDKERPFYVYKKGNDFIIESDDKFLKKALEEHLTSRSNKDTKETRLSKLTQTAFNRIYLKARIEEFKESKLNLSVINEGNDDFILEIEEPFKMEKDELQVRIKEFFDLKILENEAKNKINPQEIISTKEFDKTKEEQKLDEPNTVNKTTFYESKSSKSTIDNIENQKNTQNFSEKLVPNKVKILLSGKLTIEDIGLVINKLKAPEITDKDLIKLFSDDKYIDLRENFLSGKSLQNTLNIETIKEILNKLLIKKIGSIFIENFNGMDLQQRKGMEEDIASNDTSNLIADLKKRSFKKDIDMDYNFWDQAIQHIKDEVSKTNYDQKNHNVTEGKQPNIENKNIITFINKHNGVKCQVIFPDGIDKKWHGVAEAGFVAKQEQQGIKFLSKGLFELKAKGVDGDKRYFVVSVPEENNVFRVEESLITKGRQQKIINSYIKEIKSEVSNRKKSNDDVPCKLVLDPNAIMVSKKSQNQL